MGDSHLEGLGSVKKVAEKKQKYFRVQDREVFFPESCTAFTPFQESKLEGRDYTILKSGDHSDHKIRKRNLTLNSD